MKKKLYSLFLVIIPLFFSSIGHAKAFLLPQARPIISDKQIKVIKNNQILIPVAKPVIKKTKEETIKVYEKDEGTNSAEITFIYPEKRPIIYKKKVDKIAIKSLILSQEDFQIAKKTFNLVGKKKWQTALKVSKKSKDKNLYKLINWLYLKESSNAASFNDYKEFIENNLNYPRINRLIYLAEHKININSNSPKILMQWFKNNKPLSAYGEIKYGELLVLYGEIEEGENLIKKGFIKARLSKSELRRLRKKYKKIITSKLLIDRADWLAWEGKKWDLKRMLRYLPKDEQLLYTARQILMSNSYGVDKAISNVPKKLKKNIGLQFDRLKWRRRRGRIDPSLEILFEIPNNANKQIRPDRWWKERAILSRSLIYKKKYPLAYKVASQHSLIEGSDLAEAEWLSGWIAFSFLDDPNLALKHFKKFYANVSYPISLSRGAYWIARTYKVLNNNEQSKEWFEKSSKFINTYYGQLSYIEINADEYYELEKQKVVSEKYKKYFNKNPLVKLVKILSELNKTKYSKDILKHLALIDVDNGSEILAGNLAIEIGRYDYAIQISKNASYEKRFYNKINYPVISVPDIVNQKRMPKPELVLSVIRQESEFDRSANSSVGAKGMMQLMTYTAKLVSKQAKLPYSKNRLTTDPNYNIKLGSYYLATLLENYEGSYPFALAAYNAGPKRVKYWKKINGNPQKGEISYVDWIELIKFKETRNYVQRVLENINVYKYMMSSKPSKIENYFNDKPHY